ncbi:BEN domain-containing protein 2 isoform X2 [Melanerpes formicivorus]|uniref:BEN domain-containing protein 2 isoform X2 n=1 Tax=Melanerpes formicivorus TaxID=211600 RepID=UPI00358E34C6
MAAEGSEGLAVLADGGASELSQPAGTQRGNGYSPERMDVVFARSKRKRLGPPLLGHDVMRSREGEYEDSDNILYEYEPDYECGSIVSEASYTEVSDTGDQQKTLMEVLAYCQAMYEAIQKLDRKFDLLHRKVSELQHTRVKPLLLKPKPLGFPYRSSSHLPPGKIRVQNSMERKSNLQLPSAGQARHSPGLGAGLPNGSVQVNPPINQVPQSPQVEVQQPVQRQSPPLPTIVSTRSLHSSLAAASEIPDLLPPPNLVESFGEGAATVASSPVASSSSMPAPPESSLGDNRVVVNYRSAAGGGSSSKEAAPAAVPLDSSLEFVGDPGRNVKVPGTYLMKARQKTKPKYAARYLVRVLFPKEALMSTTLGVGARGHRTLDPNKIAAVREFLAATFPSYDLSVHGRDWNTCVTNINAMIRCLRSQPKLTLEAAEGKEKVGDGPDTSPDGEGTSQNSETISSITADTAQNAGLEKLPEAFHNLPVQKPTSLEPMDFLGSPWRKVQLPFSVIYVAKGKSRPELSARFLIRHMFTEEVLVRSNVYGNLERGMSPLDSHKINALRDFLQENFPSFDLKETGYDWKACVAAINSTIRSLRHDYKKATAGIHWKALAPPLSRFRSPAQGPALLKPFQSDTINLTD